MRPYDEVLLRLRRPRVDTAPALMALLAYSQTGDADKAMAMFRSLGGLTA